MISDDLLNRTLDNINKTPVAYNYFFQSIDSPAWLLPLKEKGFFKNPIPAIRKDGYIQFPVWPESTYLLRVADKAQNEVLEIIKSFPDTDNERVMDDVANILLKVTPSKAARFTDQVKKYVNTSQFLMLHTTVSDLVCRLADNGQFDSALELAQNMLEVMPDPERDEKMKSDYIMLKAFTKYRDYDYKTITEKVTPSLAKANPFSTIDMYAEFLQKAIDYEHTFLKFDENDEDNTDQEKQEDLSYIWRPKIAEDNDHSHDPEDVLTTALRDSVVILINDSVIEDSGKLSKLKDLAVNKYSIFKRIVEFGLRDHKDKEVYKHFYNALLADDQLKRILDGETRDVGVIKSGVVTEKPTNVLKDLADDKLIEKLKTYKDESEWSFERDSIANELSVLVKLDPNRFAALVKNIATTKNEYLDEVIRAFETAVDDLNEDSVNEILESLMSIFESGNVIDDQERHNFYGWSKSSSIRFVEKLLSRKDDKTERISEKSLGNIIDLVLLLCRTDDPSGDEDSKFEAVDLSINSTRGKALHSIAYIFAWMNRNKIAKSKYKPLFKELDWHLNPENDPSPAMRSVYGWRFALIYGTNEDWATKNMDIIFSDDKYGEAAFDAYVLFNPVHPEEINILEEVFKRQLPRLVDAPVEDGKARHDGLKNFVQHLALHYWYGDMDLSKDSIMRNLLDTANAKYIKELANFTGFRLYKSKETELEETQMKKLAGLWEEIVRLARVDSAKCEALEEFGTWFASGKFDPKWSLEQLTYAATKAGEIHLDFAALEYMETLVKEYPAESLKALSAMVDGTRERWSVSSWSKNATNIIKIAYNVDDSTVKQSASELANKLVAKGYTEYRNIIIKT